MNIGLHRVIRLVVLFSALAFTSMSYAVEPLPANLINFTSRHGQKYLEESATRNSLNLKLLSHFTTQNTTTYCGVASLVMVLNSSGITAPRDEEHTAPAQPEGDFNQTNFFTDKVIRIIEPDQVKKIGITLDQLNEIAQSFGLRSTAYHANQLTLKQFRKIAKKAILEKQFVIANFSRTALGQLGGGHHSPLAAYDKDDDRFLVLDVARYKYPAYWVTTTALWQAINTIDTDANSFRGILVMTSPKETEE